MKSLSSAAAFGGVPRWMAAALVMVLMLLATGACFDPKAADFFGPELADPSQLPDIDAVQFSDFVPVPDLLGPQNVAELGFVVFDPGGTNGAEPSGVNPQSVRVTVEGTDIAVNVSAGQWSGSLDGIADGPVEVAAEAEDLAGNKGSHRYTFDLKVTGPDIDWVLTPRLEWDASGDSQDVEFEADIMDSYLGVVTAGVYQWGADAQCGTDDDVLWPQGTDPGQVSMNFMDYTPQIGPDPRIRFSTSVYNPVQSEGESQQLDLCFNVRAGDTAGDGRGGQNPNWTLSARYSQLTFTRDVSTGSVSGTVTVDSEPLEGVTVTVDGQTQQTGADGTYSFAGLEPGSFTVALSDLPQDVVCAGASKNAGDEATKRADEIEARLAAR